MLYFAFLLVIAAVPGFPAPVSPPLKLVPRGILYVSEYRDIQLWGDTVDRIEDFIQNKEVTASDQDLVMSDVKAFVMALAFDVTPSHERFDWDSQWSVMWKYGMERSRHLAQSQINNLAKKQEKIWVDMESAKWNTVFSEIEGMFHQTPSEFKVPLGDFLRLAGGGFGTVTASNPTVTDCRMVVNRWKLQTPQPELFIKLETISTIILHFLSDYDPFIMLGSVLH
ncbi:hypothetical protein FRB96_003980 [Tulasnella sp. 330]|nr:hypothetical protein FRB96_003980 [Tulasnella sp. 330]KAG8882620.1 hypothetical protein FRB97_008047 [Tulasnella sp. 331]